MTAGNYESPGIIPTPEARRAVSFAVTSGAASAAACLGLRETKPVYSWYTIGKYNRILTAIRLRQARVDASLPFCDGLRTDDGARLAGSGCQRLPFDSEFRGHSYLCIFQMCLIQPKTSLGKILNSRPFEGPR